MSRKTAPLSEERPKAMAWTGLEGCAAPAAPACRYVAERQGTPRYAYLRDPAAVYRRSAVLIRQEADLGRFPPGLRPFAIRLAHAAGDVAILDDLVWSRGAVAAGERALKTGAPILVDSMMVAAGIASDRLAAGNRVLCTLR